MTGKIKIETVETENFAMDYFRFGHGDAVLVMLPGISVQSVMGSAAAVAGAYRPLTDDFTIWLFDRRKDLPPACSIRDMARDTAAALRTLGLERVNLFGASQGGMIAMEIALGCPELVQKLVLGSTSSRITEEQYRRFEKWIRFAEEKDAEGLYLSFGEMLYPAELFGQIRGLLTEMAKNVTDEDLRRFIIQAESTKGFDITDELEKISCPVLVLGSNDDRVLGGEASRLIIERLGSRAELFMYDGYGHAAYDTAPDYKDRILRFLTQRVD